jgi:hypothetical protein
VLGTARLPIAVLQNALGDVRTPEAALSLLTQGGIPFETLAEGGRIVAVRLDHVWVEAWVDFQPSRGAVHRTGDSWIPLDASFKHYQYQSGVSAAPPAGSALALALAQSADYDAAEGWVRHIDNAIVDAALADYRNVLAAQVGANASVADVLGDAGTIRPAARPVLAASLPYQHSQIIETLTALPAALHHRLGLKLYPSRIAQRRGEAVIATERALPAIADQQSYWKPSSYSAYRTPFSWPGSAGCTAAAGTSGGTRAESPGDALNSPTRPTRLQSGAHRARGVVSRRRAGALGAACVLRCQRRSESVQNLAV